MLWSWRGSRPCDVKLHEQSRRSAIRARDFGFQSHADIMPSILKLLHNLVRANPVVRAVKNARNGAVDHWFRRRDADAGRRLAEQLTHQGVRHVAFAIAFNSPWVIDLLTTAWRVHPVGFDLVVLDNSSDPAARAQHAEICQRRGIPWLGLPRNPEWNPNRSHGISMNWAWYNIVRQASFEIAGFIDHDCLPTTSFDLPKRMQGRSVYGFYRASTSHPQAWNMWAGYCFLRPQATAGRVIDFKHRIEFLLDTGGGNWPAFYRHLAPEAIGKADFDRIELPLGDDLPQISFQRFEGCFIHIGGVSYLDCHKNPNFRKRLISVLQTRYLAGELQTA